MYVNYTMNTLYNNILHAYNILVYRYSIQTHTIELYLYVTLN